MSVKHWKFDPDDLTMSIEVTGLMEEAVRRLHAAQLDFEESIYRQALIDMGWTPPGNAPAEILRNFAARCGLEATARSELAQRWGGYEAGARQAYLSLAEWLREEADNIESKKETPGS